MDIQPPPEDPPVIMHLDPGNSPGFFEGLPWYENEGHTVYVYSLEVQADPPLLDGIKARVAELGWESVIMTPPNRETMLSIRAKGKAIEQVRELFKQLSRGDFGPVKAAPAVMRGPSPQ